MLKVIPPRLRKPALYTLVGLVFASAWLIHGGRTWWISIVVLVGTAGRVLAVYLRAGKDTDEGALAGSRADERQQLVSLRSRALACNLAVVAAFAGLTAAVAIKASWWWPFAVILAVAGFGYLLGLSTYGASEEDPADDDEDAGQQARPPVNR